jgi:hypothetical protein
MRTQPTKTDLRRLGVIVLNISAGAAMVGVGIWLFAPDTWFSGKTAAVVALFAIPVGLVLYWLIKSLARLRDHHNSN